MSVTSAILKYPIARARETIYSRWTQPLCLQGSQPYKFEYRSEAFQGKTFIPTQQLYRLMGVPLRFFDGRFSVIVLSAADYSRYDELKGHASGGSYLPFPSLLTINLEETLEYAKHAHKAILPAGADLGILFHETMHDVYHRLLSSQEVDEFITLAAQCFQVVNDRKGIAKILNPSERVFFSFVARHAKIKRGRVVTPQKLEELRGKLEQLKSSLRREGKSTCEKSLRDFLGEENRGFFSELFSMAAEEFLGYREILFSGSLPLPLQEYFLRLGLRPCRL